MLNQVVHLHSLIQQLEVSQLLMLEEHSNLLHHLIIQQLEVFQLSEHSKLLRLSITQQQEEFQALMVEELSKLVTHKFLNYKMKFKQRGWNLIVLRKCYNS
jgi:hypothetical protein